MSRRLERVERIQPTISRRCEKPDCGRQATVRVYFVGVGTVGRFEDRYDRCEVHGRELVERCGGTMPGNARCPLHWVDERVICPVCYVYHAP